jgi:O-antigen ligase
VLQALYGLLQALVPNMGTLWVDYIRSTLGNARGTWINRNHFAGYMEMMIPLFLGFLLARVDWRGKISFKTLVQSDRPHQHGLVVLGLVLMALALLFSKSRAGITGIFVGLAVFLGLLGTGGRRVPAAAWLVMGLMACGVIIYGGRIGVDPVLERFLALGENVSRIDVWQDSLAMIADHPLGIGLAAFKPLFPLYHTTSLPGGTTPYYLHNDILQLVVDAGWLGAAALLGGLFWFMARSVGRIRRMNPSDDPGRFFPAVGALSGMAALVFHSLFDFNLHMPANAVYFVMLMAVVDSCTAAEPQPHRF